MTGYTRQSLPDIQNGSEITAPPLNAEFDQITAAFGTTGHTHDGTAGNAPKINLATSLSGYLPEVHGGTGGKNNTSATSNPTIADDTTQGYVVGSVWINTTTSRRYVCMSNATGAASWLEIPTIDANNNILPQVDNTVSIGSATYRLKDAYLGGNMDIDGTLNVATTSTLSGDVTMGGNLTLSTGTATIPTATISAGNIDNTIIGSSTPAAITATDLTTTGSATLPTVTLGQGTGTVGTLNGVIVGGSNPLAVTGTIVTANNGFTGDLTGEVTGNVTAASGTSTFTNLTASGTITGNVTGDLTGNVASAGTSTFNNVTISGTLNMDGATTATIQNLSAPVNPNDAARKTDVDTAISNLVDTAPSTLDTLNELAAALNDDPNFSTTIPNSIATKLPLAGCTMSGEILMGTNSITSMADPVNAQDAATKNYADTQDALKLNLSGGTMSGVIAMGNNTISGVPNPSANDQVSNKAYVDSILGSATSAAASAAAASTSEGNALSSANDAADSATEAEDWATETTTTVDGTEYSAKEYAIGTQTRGITGSAKDWAVYTGGTVNGTEYSAKYWSSQAETYATDAETSFNYFDTRYLGAKSAAPTTDNSGNTLATGSLYFNTSDGQLYLWTGSVWTQAAFTAQGFMSGANNLSDVADVEQSRTNLNVDEAGTALALAIALG